MLIAHTAFKGFKGRGWGKSNSSLGKWKVWKTDIIVKPISLSRTKINYLFGASLKTHIDQFKYDSATFGGIPSELIEIETPEIRVGRNENGEEYSEIVIPDEFEPGSIMVFATDMDVGSLLSSPLSLPSPLLSPWVVPLLFPTSGGLGAFLWPRLAADFDHRADPQEMSPDLDATLQAGAEKAFADLDLVDLNVILHRADGEEKDATGKSPYSRISVQVRWQTGGDGVYTIPEYGPLVYCGLEGWMNPLRHVMESNDLGHPICAHLREGTWAMDYIYDRLRKWVLFLLFPPSSLSLLSLPGLAPPTPLRWPCTALGSLYSLLAPPSACLARLAKLASRWPTDNLVTYPDSLNPLHGYRNDSKLSNLPVLHSCDPNISLSSSTLPTRQLEKR
jgi:glycogen debranching enzyme